MLSTDNCRAELVSAKDVRVGRRNLSLPESLMVHWPGKRDVGIDIHVLDESGVKIAKHRTGLGSSYIRMGLDDLSAMPASVLFNSTGNFDEFYVEVTDTR